ncbi:DnaT-like ssDNA-binding domain-containing protein [Neptunomonas antarctica]|uniref:DnaT DNA-binding domain-containing protein n=1 Tax=Neptunomonas antarctica TaxID=619304 RepID=A0A1N7M1L0_9GAMM|nr:DnaT-like ssDNA-binding domain-containing protein [Neptunomonas antarctica]SIS79943.1 hypothetical protein SAMN05421760_10580 [Neptunomonas antarctica]
MSITIPEKPLLIYPSLARKLGVEAALLLSICHEQLSIVGIPDSSGTREAALSAQQWLRVTDFWTREKVAELMLILSQHPCIQVVAHPSGAVRITDAASVSVSSNGDQPHTHTHTHTHTNTHTKTHTEIKGSDVFQSAAPVRPEVGPEVVHEEQKTSCLPVLETPPMSPRRPLPSRNTMRDRGPAPAFGGSIGWKREKDELQQLFDRHEERNQQLHMMHIGWTPSKMFFSILPRHQIPRGFVETCLDEFILYYIDKERKESNWDQKFLAWVKREWVQKQTRDAREQRNEQQRHTPSGSGINDENTRRDTKEKRKRVTAAIMDIKDTDW